MAQHIVAVVVPPEFALFELGVAVEVFALRRPEIEGDWYDVKICTAHPGPTSVGGGVLTAFVPHGIEVVDEADTVLIPDTDGVDEPATPEVLEALRRAYRRGARIVSFCTGAFVLAAAGILDGRPAATHWKYVDRLARDYPLVDVRPDVLYVDDGQVLTSAGTGAGVDLSLHIIRQDRGAKVARQVARSMVMPPHREGGQAQFVMSPVPEHGPGNGGVQQAMEHIVLRLEQDYSLDDMAALAYMSTRNFSRRFRETTGTTPTQWLLSQRLTRARELLEETDETVERVAQLAGFGSAVTLRQRFAAALHTSPSGYRRAFRAEQPFAQEQVGRPVEPSGRELLPEQVTRGRAVDGLGEPVRRDRERSTLAS